MENQTPIDTRKVMFLSNDAELITYINEVLNSAYPEGITPDSPEVLAIRSVIESKQQELNRPTVVSLLEYVLE